MPMKRLAERLNKRRAPQQQNIREAGLEYVSLADLPTWEELEKHTITWPVGFRDMLNTAPLEGRDLYIDREAAQTALQDTLQRWHDGFAPMLALIGPDACGRTTLLNWFESNLPIGETVSRITARQRIRSERELLDWMVDAFNLKEKAESIDSLVLALNNQPSRIVILDDLQRLLLRAMGTAAVVDALLSILLGTRKHFFWVVSCREYGWRLLNAQFDLCRYFTPVVKLGYFSQEQLRQGMERRLLTAGLTSTSAKEDESADESLLDNRYMQEYLAISEGNIRTALFYLLLYSHYGEEQHQLQLRKGKRVELASLRNRGDLDLFTLAEVTINGGLSVVEHAEIFHRETLKSHVVLEHLHQLRLLEKHHNETGSLYQLDPVFFIPVTAMLESAHILY